MDKATEERSEMISPTRRHFNYANVVATLALLFAMSGGALAASRILITSTKQIKPSVLKALKGAAGKTGAVGPVGPAGVAGPVGPQGPQGLQGSAGNNGEKGAAGSEGSPWTDGGTLPEGKSEHGTWSFVQSGASLDQRIPISFPIPLAAAIEPGPHEGVRFVRASEEPVTTGGCKGGSATNPIAEPGYLCIYTATEEGIKEFFNIYSSEVEGVPGAGRSGAILAFKAEEEGSQGYGDWVVTAPVT
jgi:hypothetical protein